MLLLHDIDALVTEHRGWLLRLCERRLGGDRHLAEDVVQDTFVKLSRALARGDEITNLRGWLRTVAQHGTVDELRKVRSIVVDDLPDSPVHDAVVGDGDPELEIAWNGLNPRHREVLRLRELEGLRYDEIAQAMATGVPAVETLLFRARAALRREYSRASAAVTVTAPAQVALGPLSPGRWQSAWRGSGVLRGAEAKLAAGVARAQAAIEALADRASELVAGVTVGGIAVASLLAPPAMPDLPAVEPPALPPAVTEVLATPVESTVPAVPTTPAPEVPSTTTPPASAVPLAPVAEATEPVVTVLDEVVEVVEPVLEEFSALTARLG